MRMNWQSLKRWFGNRKRSRVSSKKSEMLEIRISLPLKQALEDHCRSSGVNRSAFVRAAIDERIMRERRRLPALDLAGGRILTVARSRAGLLTASLLLMLISLNTASYFRDASAAYGLRQMASIGMEQRPVVAPLVRQEDLLFSKYTR
jgi:hypothetical protein